jgi:hypothetical protein
MPAQVANSTGTDGAAGLHVPTVSKGQVRHFVTQDSLHDACCGVVLWRVQLGHRGGSDIVQNIDFRLGHHEGLL